MIFRASLKEAFYLAQSGRPGPVLIDLPKNVRQARTQPVSQKETSLRSYRADPRANELALNEIIGLIEKSERPVLYVGGGIISGNASKELRQFAEATQIPVTTTLMGCGACSSASPVAALAGHAARRLQTLNPVNGEYHPAPAHRSRRS